ncbi:hypothetical protein SH528x_002828 [Novipirellula sp. SH528]|uniref:hypothetical protein n=1 Tax=Novipirellula sp. SH528 TaxID=3454466 RepID=UPI003FA0B190
MDIRATTERFGSQDASHGNMVRYRFDKGGKIEVGLAAVPLPVIAIVTRFAMNSNNISPAVAITTKNGS